MAFPFLAAAAALPAIYQGITGIKQARQANKMNPIRPTYTIPGAVGEMTEIARMNANGMMPGFGTAQNNIQGGTANAVRSAQQAGSGNNVLATIAAAQGNEANAMNNLATQNSQFMFGQRQNLQNALLQQAGYQEKAWDYNQRQKYEEEAAAKAALKESAMQNQNNALGGLASTGMMGAMQVKKPTIPGALNMHEIFSQISKQPGNRTYNDAANYKSSFPGVTGMLPHSYNGFPFV